MNEEDLDKIVNNSFHRLGSLSALDDGGFATAESVTAVTKAYHRDVQTLAKEIRRLRSKIAQLNLHIDLENMKLEE